MPDKFQNKYRIPSARASWWDYGNNGAYFITICTKNREHYFGEIVERQMHLTPIGQSLHDYWNEIPKHFPFVLLDEFVVMPNHVHGIIVICKTGIKIQNTNGDVTYNMNVDQCCIANVETQNFASLHSSKNKNAFGPQSQNLASIVRGFKIGVTKFAKSHNIEFKWQSRFYDHIIRSKESYQKIRNYIISNPGNWITDKFKN